MGLCIATLLLIADMKYDGAVIITASHLPFNRNGFKFFDNKAGFEKKEISDLLSRAAKDAGQGSLEEDSKFPRDRAQAEASAVQTLEKSFNAEPSLVQKVICPLSSVQSSAGRSCLMINFSSKNFLDIEEVIAYTMLLGYEAPEFSAQQISDHVQVCIQAYRGRFYQRISREVPNAFQRLAAHALTDTLYT